jgi:hypothetical protein
VDSSSDRVKSKTKKLVLVASPINTQHYAEKAKTGWLETFWSSTKADLIIISLKIYFFRHDIAEKLLSWH